MSVVSPKDVQLHAQGALNASPIYALRGIRVEQTGETIVLSGSVSSFYHKQLAQEAVRQLVSGVEVVNSIRVR
jgi:osmotically-inducible protein OsmY